MSLIYKKTPTSLSTFDRDIELNERNIKVAFYSPQADWSTFRYRCLNMSNGINTYSDAISSSWFHKQDKKLHDVFKNINVLVISRAPLTAELRDLIISLRSQGTYIFFDLDDLIFEIDDIDLILNTIDKSFTDPQDYKNEYDRVHSYISGINETIELSDVLICTNTFLANKLKKSIKSLPM